MKIDGPAGRLHVALHEPSGPARWGVLVSHPHPLLGGHMDNQTVKAVAEACRERGGLVLRYNVRGAGESGGELDPDRSLPEQGAEDAEAALAFLRERLPGNAPVFLAGYSFGALVTLELLKRGERPPRVVFLGLPLNTDGLKPDFTILERFGKPALLIQGVRDEYGRPEEARPLLPKNVELHVVDRSGHFFTGKWGQVGEVAAGFLAGHLRQP